MTKRVLFGLAVLCIGALAGCRQQPAVLLPQPVWETLPPLATQLPSATPLPTATPNPYAWNDLRPGLALRRVPVAAANGLVDQMTVLRFEPQYFRFSVGYIGESAQSVPLPLSTWQSMTAALLVVNGGYYRLSDDGQQRYLANGITIANGQRFGYSYDGFGGMLTIDDAGNPALRSLRAQPFSLNESWLGALQSFPMLTTLQGGSVQIDDTQRARRTAVAQDQVGRFLVVVTENNSLTLTEWSSALVNADLQIALALNLDGGPSTGLLFDDPTYQQHIQIPAGSPLPQVILAYAR